MKAYRQLQDWWARSDSRIATQETSEHLLESLEERYSIRLPDDFRQYLRLSAPVGEACDRENTAWWPYERIKNIPEEYPHKLSPFLADQSKSYLFFADYAIWCWAWAISCADDGSRGRVVLVAGESLDRFVADDFSDFVGRYVRDVRSVC